MMRCYSIADYCKMLGISQTKLAEKLGVTPSNLSAKIPRKHIVDEDGQFYTPTRTKHNRNHKEDQK